MNQKTDMIKDSAALQVDNGCSISPETAILSSDDLLRLAETANARIAAANKIKLIVLKSTNANDWIGIGKGDKLKPYCQASGIEKIANACGVGWDINEPPTKLPHDDGHYTIKYTGKFWYGKRMTNAIGTKNSNNPFFSVRYNKQGEQTQLPPSEVDEANIMKAAFTNCLWNGVSNLLGIKNFTVDELLGADIDLRASGNIEYGNKGSSTTNGSFRLASAKQKGLIWFKLKEATGGNEEKAKEIFKKHFNVQSASDNIAMSSANDFISNFEGYLQDYLME